MKDHEKRDLVGAITDIAVTFGHTQQLRSRMAGAILPVLEEMVRLHDEISRLRGIQPAVPPRPNEGNGLPRFGIRWNGSNLPISTPMTDGYWTPWHLAQKEIDRLKGTPS